MKTPDIAYPLPYLKIISSPPPSLNLFLLPYFFDWMDDRATIGAILLDDIMNLHMLNLHFWS